MNATTGTWVRVNAAGDIEAACNVVAGSETLTDEYARGFVTAPGRRLAYLTTGRVRLGAPLADYNTCIRESFIAGRDLG